ncbi:MAG TPA: exodeoxyribonuclease VII large subunit [Syntrophomonadaceae bacterium]|nr:exodeoxyribonuclease VII large subunit [Syntrophomonadaceae bacterium]HOQ09082.1 exodeoxyribonuclease VII large subunit [Syntrophomonadaceae bacterium]HPU48625.1 exodeoxyribonuclease VII large subunit [Syntrophomonadaceae bacterium]
MNPYLTVSELNQYIADLLDGDIFLRDFWLKGEISGFKLYQQSGHLYFTLKDADSSISAVMFRSRARRLEFKPENGMEVLVRGSVSVFAPQGRYQLYVEEMEPYGVGGVYLFLEQLKEKLQQKGYFDVEKKKPLPAYARRIGVVTSQDGAALRDILRVLRQRHRGVDVVLVHSAVQGAEAPEQIARGIKLLNLYGQVDLIIVGRGGGSFEDLMPFNSEEVVRAIYESELPVISAVGHEVDWTLADLAADVRAATPTQAAQLAVADLEHLSQECNQLQQRLIRIMQRRLQQESEILDRLMMNRAWQKPRQMVQQYQQYCQELRVQMQKAMENRVNQSRQRLAMAVSGLERLSPLKVMQRGYAVVHNQAGIIKSVENVQPGDCLSITLLDGELCTQVKQKEKVIRWNL